MMLSNRGLDSDAREAGARQAGRWARTREGANQCHTTWRNLKCNGESRWA
jgi:hypothetical protein